MYTVSHAGISSRTQVQCGARNLRRVPSQEGSREELLKRGTRDYRERDFPCPRLHPRFVVHAHFTVSEVVARDVLYQDIIELAVARLFSRARAM